MKNRQENIYIVKLTRYEIEIFNKQITLKYIDSVTQE